MGGSVQLRNPDTGTTFGFSLPLPPAVAAQVRSGELVEPGAQIEAELREHETVPMPRGNASLARWIEYAASQGLDGPEVTAMTRNEIRARFTDPQFDPAKPPGLED